MKVIEYGDGEEYSRFEYTYDSVELPSDQAGSVQEAIDAMIDM